MAGEAEDVFLSDVHIGNFNSPSNKVIIYNLVVPSGGLQSSISTQGTVSTRFVVLVDGGTHAHAQRADGVLDDDGDLVLDRREQLTVIIEHSMATPLKSVGMQVWRGALLLGDYMLSRSSLFQGASVLELGAGVGLLSVVAATMATEVLSTDIGEDTLELCQRNVESNLTRLEGVRPVGRALVRELDWKRPLEATGRYSWQVEDMKILERVTFIIAADVVYEDLLTDAFFSCLAEVCTHMEHSPLVIVALEKRVNFTLEDLAPASPAYQHFRACLEKGHCWFKGSKKVRFRTRQLSTDFPQYFRYERVKELELWELQIVT